MLIREAGIIFNGVRLISTHCYKASKGRLESISTNMFMNGLLTFAECLIAPIEYFENNNYTIVFKKGKLCDYFGTIRDLFAYLVMDRDIRLEKYLYKKITPVLEEVLKKFTSQYYGCKITEVTQFEPFKTTMDAIIY
ncbi:MAG: hypothetical protein ACFFFB_21305 [Candidatus Heimdallarchaeota archaeon]